MKKMAKEQVRILALELDLRIYKRRAEIAEKQARGLKEVLCAEGYTVEEMQMQIDKDLIEPCIIVSYEDGEIVRMI